MCLTEFIADFLTWPLVMCWIRVPLPIDGCPAMTNAASSDFSRSRALLSPRRSRSQVQVLSKLRFRSEREFKVMVGKISLHTLEMSYKLLKHTWAILSGTVFIITPKEEVNNLSCSISPHTYDFVPSTSSSPILLTALSL